MVKVKTSLYLPQDLKAKVEIHCINLGIKTVNDFYLQAVIEKMERDAKNVPNT